MKYWSEKNVLFSGKFVQRVLVGIEKTYIKAKQ